MLCCVGSALLSLVELLLLQQLNDSVATLAVELAENRHAQQELAELHLLHLTERMRHVWGVSCALARPSDFSRSRTDDIRGLAGFCARPGNFPP